MNPLDTGEVFSLDFMNPNPTSSKTKEGPKYRVSFEIEREPWEMFMDAETKGMVLEMQGRVTAKNEPMPDKPKGGPLSIKAAMLCGERNFQKYVEGQGQLYPEWQGFTPRDYICKWCGVTSRAYLDHDARAATEFECLSTDYFMWLGYAGTRS